MMGCRQVEKRFVDYMDGALGSRERLAVEAHLAICEACRSALEDMTAAIGALRSLPPVRPPATFAPRVRSAIRAAAPSALAPPLVSRSLRTALGVAFGALLFISLMSRYLVQSRPYTGLPPMTMVAQVSPEPQHVRTHVTTASKHQPVPSVQRPTRTATTAPRASHLRSSDGRSVNAIMGVPRSGALLVRKPATPTVERAPAVGHASVRRNPVPDVEVRPAVREESRHEVPGVVALPAADALSTSGPLTEVPSGVLLASASSELETTSSARPVSGEDARFDFEDLFNESSLPYYSDVS